MAFLLDTCALIWSAGAEEMLSAAAKAALINPRGKFYVSAASSDEEAYSLPEPFHPDLVDRIMVATARVHDLVPLTADRKILDYPHVRSAW
jgi:PIN domain nuclease of toxin-antitoxin system